MEKPKDKKMEILLSIRDYIEKRGYSPTVREIGKLVGYKSTSTVQGYLIEMEVWGMIERQRASPRVLKITEKGRRMMKAHDGIGM
ncbi:LexA DNA binding domain-containing protein [Natronincola peptidivorans]|uniref:LexA DNA binding domain-containing protein n=1 Tax=Natronincola peptidivorans TaxID=426128 RepID=A0A1I0EKT5_9FIRM|nr:hypothetical protein [Natronincola peptidivorans]SET45864.1 LexA DNA binding domain-containing protein [Natronincola peptidivorans]